MSRFLITGGTGFIGRALTAKLRAQNHSVTPMCRHDADLTDWEQTRDFMIHLAPGFDYILHCADLHGDARWSAAHAADQLLSNTAITVNVLDAWQAYQPQARFVAMGSALAYPVVEGPVSETQYWDGPPANLSYGLGKRLLSTTLAAIKQQHGLNGTTLILGNVYGPGDASTRLIPTVLKKMLAGDRSIDLWTNGNELRPFIYLDDQIDRILACLDYNGDLLNVGPGVSWSVRGIVEDLQQVTDYRGMMLWQPWIAPSCRLSTERAQVWVKEHLPSMRLHLMGLKQTRDALVAQ